MNEIYRFQMFCWGVAAACVIIVLYIASACAGPAPPRPQPTAIGEWIEAGGGLTYRDVGSQRCFLKDNTPASLSCVQR